MKHGKYKYICVTISYTNLEFQKSTCRHYGWICVLHQVLEFESSCFLGENNRLCQPTTGRRDGWPWVQLLRNRVMGRIWKLALCECRTVQHDKNHMLWYGCVQLLFKSLPRVLRDCLRRGQRRGEPLNREAKFLKGIARIVIFWTHYFYFDACPCPPTRNTTTKHWSHNFNFAQFHFFRTIDNKIGFVLVVLYQGV